MGPLEDEKAEKQAWEDAQEADVSLCRERRVGHRKVQFYTQNILFKRAVQPTRGPDGGGSFSGQ